MQLFPSLLPLLVCPASLLSLPTSVSSHNQSLQLLFNKYAVPYSLLLYNLFYFLIAVAYSSHTAVVLLDVYLACAFLLTVLS